MKGDFTRFTHDPEKQYNRVLKQQGRVALDADWNEHVAIRSYLERTEAADVIGCCGVPQEGGGFEIQVVEVDEEENYQADRTGEWGNMLAISPGRIYVDGLLCENPPVDRAGADADVRLMTEQDQYPTFDLPKGDAEGELYVVYLDVWERHVTALEDGGLREIALGGPDTTTRVQTVWQVKMEKYEETGEFEAFEDAQCPPCNWRSRSDEPRLRAWADPSERQESLCEMPEAGGYRGIENRLYRIEVHEGGTVGEATFKWSRDNGAVVYSIEAVDTTSSLPSITLGDQPRDETLSLRPGEWVEITWKARELEGRPGVLGKIDSVGREEGGASDRRAVWLDASSLTGSIPDPDDVAQLKVRRWDHSGDESALPVREGEAIELESGVYITFEEGREYRTGDYWTIPARAIIENVLWPPTSDGSPSDDGTSAAFRPREGIDHHHCPLALVELYSDDGDLRLRKRRDCRREFPSLTEVRKTCCRAVTPEDDLRQAIAEVADAGGGCISLCRGVYRLEAPLELHDIRNLTIHGVGSATILHLVNTSGTASGGIVLEDCRRVRLEDMLVLGEGVPAVVRTAGDNGADTENRSLTVHDVTAVHRRSPQDIPDQPFPPHAGEDLVRELEERSPSAMRTIRETTAEAPVSEIPSALRLSNVSDVRVENSRLFAPIGILAPWDDTLPEAPVAPERPEPEDEERHVDFEDQSERNTFDIGDEIESGNATFSVARSAVGHESASAVVVEREARMGILCGGTRLDLNFVQRFDGSAVDLVVRGMNQQNRAYELRINGVSETVDGGVAEFDGRTIGGVEVSVTQDDERELGQILSFSGNVYTFGIGGTTLFVDDLRFRIQPLRDLPEPEIVDYGDGVSNVEVDDSEIYFSRWGILAARCESWTVSDSRLRQISSYDIPVDVEIPDRFETVRQAEPIFELMEALSDAPPSQQLPRQGTAVHVFLWRDSTLGNCEVHAVRGFESWWQVRSTVADNTLTTSRRGLHAFWLFEGDWKNNRIEGASEAALSFGGSCRARIVGNRTESSHGLVNESVSELVEQLLRLLEAVGQAYGLPRESSSAARVLWIFLEETVRLMGLRDLVQTAETTARTVYHQIGLYGGVGSIHDDLVSYPILYAAARRLLPLISQRGTAYGDRRPLPIVGLELRENRMVCGADAIALDDFFTAGGIDIVDNRLQAGTAADTGQTIRLNTSPYSANAHLMNMLAKLGVEALNNLSDNGEQIIDGDSLGFSADNRIRGNRLSSLNTAIESNLFDLEVRGNYITLRARTVSNPEVDAGISNVEQNEHTAPAGAAAREGSTSELRYMRTHYAAEAGRLKGAADGRDGPDDADASTPFSEVTARYVSEISEAVERGDRRATAVRMVGLLDRLMAVTNTYGIWLKGPGARIVENHVAVSPELKRSEQPRGGIRLEGEEMVPQIISASILAGESPLLGITETVVASNEIMDGIGIGVDVGELFAAGSAAPKHTSHQAAQGHPLYIRGNEINGMARGGIVLETAVGVEDMELVENRISACGGGADEYEIDRVYGGIYARDIVRGRFHGNRVVESPDGVLAVEIEATAQVMMTDNTLRGEGRRELYKAASGTVMAASPEVDVSWNLFFRYLGKITALDHATISTNLLDPEDPSTTPLELDISSGHGIVTSNTATGDAPISIVGANVESGFNHPPIP